MKFLVGIILVFDLLSISYFYQGNFEKSLEYSKEALKMSPNDERLLQNNKIIEDEYKKNCNEIELNDID